MSLLGDHLKELRGQLSLYEVAKGSGIATADLSRYEQGKYLPTASNLKKLAAYFELPYPELRQLYYTDFFSDVEERDIVVAWAFQQELSVEGNRLLTILTQVAPSTRQTLIRQITQMLETLTQSSLAPPDSGPD